MSARVRISGWQDGAKKISATKELQCSTELGLARAKKVVDDVLEGATVDVVPLENIGAEVLAARLSLHGFVSSVHSAPEEKC